MNRNILNEVFAGLIEEGYIYDEDENGLGMSYGEYEAVQDYIIGTLLETADQDFADFPEFLQNIIEIVETTGDDVRLFAAIDTYKEAAEDILYYADEDDNNLIKLPYYERIDMLDWADRYEEYCLDNGIETA